MGTPALVVIALIIVLTVYAGLRDGAFFAAYALMRNLLAFLFAMTFHEPLTRVLMLALGSQYPARDYLSVIAFGAIFGTVFAVGRWLKMRYISPHVMCVPLMDHIAGPLVGLLSGILVTGTLLILWSMLPFAKYIPADRGDLQLKFRALDTGVAMMRFYGHIERRLGGGRPFLLEDEPIDVDENGNGRADPGDTFRDLNGNGQWDRGQLWRYRNYAAILPTDLKPLQLRRPPG